MLGEDEVLHTPLDKKSRNSNNFPGEGFRRRQTDAAGKPVPGRSIVWTATEAVQFAPAPVWGAFPQGFAEWALVWLQTPRKHVLHLCSGALGPEIGGVRVDIRAAARPDVRADARRLPFRDESFGAVLIDPPYSVEYAQELYQTDYPRPSHLLKEAARVVKPGGRVGFVHFLVPHSNRTNLDLEKIIGVTKGCGYRIFAFTIFRRQQRGLFD